MHILIVEDDLDMQKILKLYLQKEGFIVSIVSNGQDAIEFLSENHVHLVIMDWMMPLMDGIQTCREIRLLQIPTKILMLTAKGDNEDEIKGLTCGADDYLRKPFNIQILLLRIRKLCRAENLLSFQDIRLNPDTMEVTKHGERIILIDYISLHNYYGNPANDTAAYLASSVEMDKFIRQVAAICDEVKFEKKSDKTMNLSFDEWNIWFHSNEQDKQIPKWQIAPPLLEDVYNLEDAVVVGSLLITLLNHCDRVKIACLAQLVNVLAPVMTETGGRCWAQTIFYPFMYTSMHGRGTAIRTFCTCGCYDTEKLKDIPYLDAAAVISEDEREIALFVVNRSLSDECELAVDLAGYPDYRIHQHISMEGDDLKAINTADEPEKVVPVSRDISGNISLSPHSWNMIVFKKQ